MMYRRIAAVVSVLCVFAVSEAQTDTKKMNQYIDNLMRKMTLQEKIGQLNLMEGDAVFSGDKEHQAFVEHVKSGSVGAMLNVEGVRNVREVQRIAIEESRLHIPLFFGLDVIHGFSTVFPIPLGLSCSWDLAAIERSARVAAVEASADGICWTYSPMVDICHDARWGRIAEGAGEDPYLGSKIAEAMVRGYQGENLSDSTTIMACVKHFGLYGASEAGRDYNTVDMSRWRMYNEYLPPYKAALDAGAGTVMSSFNIVDGIPATANKWLLTDLLRKEWGFKGMVVTDYASIDDMMSHGYGDLQTNSAAAINAGTDMDMCADGFVGTLEQSVREGKVSVKTIDEACRRVLEVKYKLGLFDDPYRYCDTTRYDRWVLCAEHRAEARKTAAECLVLLKNQESVLPLKKQGKIALIGPMADNRLNLTGTWSWSAQPDRYMTLLEGMRKAVGDKAEILYAKGSNLMYDADKEAIATRSKKMRDARSDAQLLNEALAVANKADVIVVALGECAEMSGEGGCRVDLELPDAQKALLRSLVATGKPIVMLNFSGRPVVLNWEQEHVQAILQCWFAGSETADAIPDVLFGDVCPSGKLTTTFPRHVGQLPLSYAYYATGRPQGESFKRYRSNYLDVRNDGLYPFGYGLSYTTFSYSDVSLSDTVMNNSQTLTASVTVTNTGSVKGDEIVQLYLHDVYATTVRPVKELKGFERISLNPGESKKVTFVISEPMLRFYNQNCDLVSEPGAFEVMIAPNSRDIKSVKRFCLTK
ncbi:MAG: beta-glucosidase BglX [Bacteroidales bacterium]|nr:beta-glucosidase BglX [Candidatus Colimorpha onthohippi]